MDCLSEVMKGECIEGNSQRLRTELWGMGSLRRKLDE